jgi:D-sedoheptulose 7-phosphate isomerase
MEVRMSDPSQDARLSHLRESFEASARVKRLSIEACGAAIADAAALAIETLRGDGRILTFGNGGSAADAQHFADELAGRFDRERPALPALALTANTSDLTAIGNDYGFDHVFARLVQAHGRMGDLAVAISTSDRRSPAARELHHGECRDYGVQHVLWARPECVEAQRNR